VITRAEPSRIQARLHGQRAGRSRARARASPGQEASHGSPSDACLLLPAGYQHVQQRRPGVWGSGAWLIDWSYWCAARGLEGQERRSKWGRAHYFFPLLPTSSCALSLLFLSVYGRGRFLILVFCVQKLKAFPLSNTGAGAGRSSRRPVPNFKRGRHGTARHSTCQSSYAAGYPCYCFCSNDSARSLTRFTAARCRRDARPHSGRDACARMYL
jgi:hypothetical protein